MTFQISFPGTETMISPGEPVSIHFSDGKGVSARLAGVDIEHDGSSFVIICTQDGNVDECTCPPNGIDALTLANADLICERDHLRERLSNGRRDWSEQHDRMAAALTLATTERDELRSRATNADDEIHHLRANLSQLMEQLNGEQARAERWERQATRWEGMYRTQFEMSTDSVASDPAVLSFYDRADNAKMEHGEDHQPLSIKDGPQQLVINLYLTGDH